MLQGLPNSGVEGDYRCVHVNVEDAQTAREDAGRAVQTVLGRLGARARLVLRDRLLGNTVRGLMGSADPLQRALLRSSEATPIRFRLLGLGLWIATSCFVP